LIETLITLFRIDPIVKFLLKALEKQGCPFRREHIICEPCSIRMGGEFDPKRGVILCENQISIQKQFNDALSHELIHAFDHCRAFVEWQDCRHHACAEVS
jgi:mitochondrial inner membrane protease ATP23